MLNHKMGIVGAGRIAACEATLMSGHGCEVILVGNSEKGLARCRAEMEANWDELIASGLAAAGNKRAALARTTLTLEYAALAGCEFVMEAVVEQIDVKRMAYQKMEIFCGAEAIFASTTSAISVDVLASELQHPERFVVAHPFQPAHMLPLVELVGGTKTSPETLARAKILLEELDRVVVTLHKSVPGFIINRLAQALFRESLYLIEQGVASAEDIDKAVKYAIGMRYASIGLLEYFDDVGFALEGDIAASVYQDLCSTRDVQETVRCGIKSGATGRTAGKGLYDWTQKDDAEYLCRKAAPYRACFRWDMPSE